MTELVSSIAVNVIEKLGSLAYQEISLAWGIASDLKKLEDTMSTIQAVLLDAEEKQAEKPPAQSLAGATQSCLS